MQDGVIILHYNMTQHIAQQTQQWFHKYGWEVLQHRACSPDLAPSDIHFFGPLKQHLLWQWFVNNDDVTAVLMTCLQVLAQELQSDSIRWFPARRVPQEV
jgi:hypothetical protein